MDEILADLSIEDTWWLRNFEKLEERIQVFDFLSKSVVRDKKSARPSIWFRSNAHCGEIIHPGLQFWLDRFYQLVVGETVKAQKRAKRKKEAVSNMSSLVRWGIRLLKDSKWRACWTDKTSSYALVEKRQISTIHDDILDKQMYIPTVYNICMVDSHFKGYLV